MKAAITQHLTCLAVSPRPGYAGDIHDEAQERIAQARAICQLAAGRAVNGYVDELDANVLEAADVLLGQAELMFAAAGQPTKKPAARARR